MDKLKKNNQMNVRLDAELMRLVEQMAAEEDRTISHMGRVLIKEALVARIKRQAHPTNKSKA